MKGLGALWGSCLESVFHFERYFLASSDSSVGQKSHIFPILSYLALGTDLAKIYTADQTWNAIIMV